MEKKHVIFLRWGVVLGALILLNIIGSELYLRFDFTEDQRYSLSTSTEELLEEIDDPVTIRVFFSGGVPPDLKPVKDQLRSLLVEYNEKSDGQVAFEFLDPSVEEDYEMEAVQGGVSPKYLRVREKDEARERRIFMGAILQTGQRSVTIPFIEQNTSIEYQISRHLDQLLDEAQPSIGIIGNGDAAGKDELSEIVGSLENFYEIEEVNLSNYAALEQHNALVFVDPKASISSTALGNLELYLSQEDGGLFLAHSTADPDWSRFMIDKSPAEINQWLSEHGINITNHVIIDSHSGSMEVPMEATQDYQATVQFPYFPVVTNFNDHPVNQGVSQIFMPWTSLVTINRELLEDDQWEILSWSSDRAGLRGLPFEVDLEYEWSQRDFNNEDLPAAVYVDAPLFGEATSELIVAGSGYFPLSQHGAAQSESNVIFSVNSIDWLAGARDIVELRGQQIRDRPIDDPGGVARESLKYGNAILPLLLVFVIGALRYGYQFRKRRKWLQTSDS